VHKPEHKGEDMTSKKDAKPEHKGDGTLYKYVGDYPTYIAGRLVHPGNMVRIKGKVKRKDLKKA